MHILSISKKLKSTFFEPVRINFVTPAKKKEIEIKSKFEHFDLLENFDSLEKFAVTNFSTKSVDHCISDFQKLTDFQNYLVFQISFRSRYFCLISLSLQFYLGPRNILAAAGSL